MRFFYNKKAMSAGITICIDLSTFALEIKMEFTNIFKNGLINCFQKKNLLLIVLLCCYKHRNIQKIGLIVRKTGLPGFRQSKIQTRLLSYRD